MAQPPFIPQNSKSDPAKGASLAYSSPAYVPKSWRANRPGDIVDEGNPKEMGFGDQGPDQGYVLKLAEDYKGKLCLEAGEHSSDILVGCARLALRRASLLGRAPIKEDLEAAFHIFGYLSESPPAGLVEFRQKLLNGIAHDAGVLLMQLAAAVPADVLKLKASEIQELQGADWSSVFSDGSS